MSDINNAIKMLVKQMMDNCDLSDIVTGTVTSVSPLAIKIDAKITLTDDFLVLTNNVRNYDVDVSFNWDSTPTGISLPTKAKCKVHNALKVGDDVLLVQQTGGQMYIVLDKIK